MRILTLLAALALCACSIPGREEYNAGVAAYNAGDYDKAILQFQAAIQKNPQMGEAHQGLAECYFTKEQLKEARDSYREAKKLYDQGIFQDTDIENEKKKARVDMQLDWLEKAIALDEEISSSSKPATNPTASQPAGP